MKCYERGIYQLLQHHRGGALRESLEVRASKSFFLFCFFVSFLGPHLLHMEVPKVEVKSELRLPAYTTAIAVPDPSKVCNLHHSS